MDVVVDASVIIAVIADEPERAALIGLTQGTDLIAPHSVHWEVGNAFSAMFKRGRITLPRALRAMAAYRQIPIRLVDVELEESLEIAQRLEVYAYDAYLIRCAVKYMAPLISLDQHLIEGAKEMKVKVLEV
jgi:predicted nucleic acid-binding protein